MNTLLFALMIATLLVLIAGVILMASGGKLNKKYSNQLMMLRVILQASAIGLLFMMYVMFHK
jgi:hypothetical protein